MLSQGRLNPTADQAVLLLQRTQDFMLECPAFARQLWQHSQERPGPPSSTPYGVMVTALEVGLMVTLHEAVELLWQPVGTAGEEWLNEQDKELGAHGPAQEDRLLLERQAGLSLGQRVRQSGERRYSPHDLPSVQARNSSCDRTRDSQG